jgi:hypothetical protein
MSGRPLDTFALPTVADQTGALATLLLACARSNRATGDHEAAERYQAAAALVANACDVLDDAPETTAGA